MNMERGFRPLETSGLPDPELMEAEHDLMEPDGDSLIQVAEKPLAEPEEGTDDMVTEEPVADNTLVPPVEEEPIETLEAEEDQAA